MPLPALHQLNELETLLTVSDVTLVNCCRLTGSLSGVHRRSLDGAAAASSSRPARFNLLRGARNPRAHRESSQNILKPFQSLRRSHSCCYCQVWSCRSLEHLIPAQRPHHGAVWRCRCMCSHRKNVNSHNQHCKNTQRKNNTKTMSSAGWGFVSLW